MLKANGNNKIIKSLAGSLEHIENAAQLSRLFPIASNLSGCFSICHGGYFLCTTGTYFYFY